MGEIKNDEKRWKGEIPVASEKMYTLDPQKMRKKFLPIERETGMYKMMQKIYDAGPMDNVDNKMYQRGGIQQSKAKQEFTEWGKKIALDRGIPSYNREVGLPLCQRSYEPMYIVGTDVAVDFDDVNFFNNTAFQQMFDDIKRTVIVNLDVAHRTIQLRLGKEISPETMNLFMETLQHRLGGGAVIREHMAEVHPGLTSDAYGKVFTGDDELTDQFDHRFIINLNKEFHPKRADMLKVGVGEKLSLAVHEPTLRVRNMDGAAIVRSAAQSATMAFVATYRLTGESVLSDIAFSTRHAQQVRMGENMWGSRSHAPNELGGMTYGYLADCCPAESELPPICMMEMMTAGDADTIGDLMQSMMQCGAMSSELIENIWYGSCMAGGIGFPCAGYAFLGGFEGMFDVELFSGGGSAGGIVGGMGNMATMLKGHKRMPAKWTTIKPFIHMACEQMMTMYEKYPTMMEFHWSGAVKMGVAGGAGALAAFLTGDTLMANQGCNYAIALLAKEGWLRTGWSGQEVQDQVGLAYDASIRIEEGGLPELKGPNVPYMSYTAGHSAIMGTYTYGGMLGRGSAWACSPLVKVAFSDRDLAFDFRHVREEFAKGALREFEPAGERDLLRPAR